MNPLKRHTECDAMHMDSYLHYLMPAKWLFLVEIHIRFAISLEHKLKKLILIFEFILCSVVLAITSKLLFFSLFCWSLFIPLFYLSHFPWVFDMIFCIDFPWICIQFQHAPSVYISVYISCLHYPTVPAPIYWLYMAQIHKKKTILNFCFFFLNYRLMIYFCKPRV